MAKYDVNYVWQDKKRGIFGLPISCTKYTLTDTKLLITSGFLSKTEDEIRLYRIMDVTLRQSLSERLNGCGTIHCCSGDQSAPEFDIKHIKNPREVKDMLSDMVEKARDEKHVTLRENMMNDDEDGEIRR